MNKKKKMTSWFLKEAILKKILMMIEREVHDKASFFVAALQKIIVRLLGILHYRWVVSKNESWSGFKIH